LGGLTLPRSNPIWNMAGGRHLEKNGYDVITRAPIDRLLWYLASRCKMTCQWLYIGQNRNRK